MGRSKPPGRGVKYLLPLKVFFYAMPFPARQQGGLTGDYVSLPGYTETKRRVRQAHPPLLTPLLPSATSSPQLIPFPAAFDTPSSQTPLSCSEILAFIYVDSAKVPSTPLWSSFLCFFYTLHCPPPTLCLLFHFLFPSVKNFKCSHPKNNY